MKYSAVILAAGSGERVGLGYNKLLYMLKNQTMIETTVEVFEQDEDCQEIVLVISKKDEEVMHNLFKERVKFVFGGTTRQESSYNGVNVVKTEYVMIHDGARPYVSMQELERCKEGLEESDACLLMVPVKDTIKRVVDGRVEETFDRSTLMAALTPQCFKTTLIQTCLKKAITSHTVFYDDASVVEKLSDVKVKAILGEYANIKITTKEDL